MFPIRFKSYWADSNQEIASLLSLKMGLQNHYETYLLFNNFRRKRLLRDHPKCPSASVFVWSLHSNTVQCGKQIFYFRCWKQNAALIAYVLNFLTSFKSLCLFNITRTSTSIQPDWGWLNALTLLSSNFWSFSQNKLEKRLRMYEYTQMLLTCYNCGVLRHQKNHKARGWIHLQRSRTEDLILSYSELLGFQVNTTILSKVNLRNIRSHTLPLSVRAHTLFIVFLWLSIYFQDLMLSSKFDCSLPTS